MGQAGQAEIHDQDFAAPVEHDVGRLQIAVQHAFVVRGGQAGADLARDLQRFVGGQAADAAQQRRQVFAVDVFHGEERLIVGFADVVDAADIGMRDAARNADFVAEALERVLVGERFRQKLERHCWPRRQIVGAIDLAHAAASQQRDER